MVLLGGDLFHDNKPSRKSMYQVMRSLRMNCLGEKPCEIELLSDPSTNFDGAFDHANYEDPDINVAIPVFSIHGNHDDPSGEGKLAALDILSVAGLINYFGRTPENDNIVINPVLLQKGGTKLALYGMSNVRDERLFRTFRDGKVKFLRPNVRIDEWFNLMVVHQNHYSHTDTDYLPENFLQEFLDLVIWGHEHECLINPRKNPEMGFSVMQPGSSIATSLSEGEAATKQVAILSITGRDYEVEPIRLRTVRPFVMREMVLAEEKELRPWATRVNNRAKVTEYLKLAVEELIEQAKQEWLDAQGEDTELTKDDAPLPLVRLRVEYSAPEGGMFETENPQRFSNRFVGLVANSNDVVQFYRKKTSIVRKTKAIDEVPKSVIEHLDRGIDNIRVEKLVQGFLESQSLSVLAENGLGDAISQFVDKDDKHAVEQFVSDSLKTQITKLMDKGLVNEQEIQEAMEQEKSNLATLFQKGLYKPEKRGPSTQTKPADWDSDSNGPWEEQEEEEQEERESLLFGSEPSSPEPASRRGGKKASARAAPARSRKVATPDDDDVVMIDDDDEDEEEYARPTRSSRAKAPATKKAPARKPPCEANHLKLCLTSLRDSFVASTGKTGGA